MTSVCVSQFGSESLIYKGAAVDEVILRTRQKGVVTYISVDSNCVGRTYEDVKE